MKTLQYISLSGLLIIAAIYSCEKIDPPYLELTDKCVCDTLSVPIRKILLEEYTGHRCGNCPRAHEKAEELHSIYCDQIISVEIHAGFFAMPLAPFNADYRTTAGTGLDDYFEVSASGLPKGLVNRKELNGNIALAKDDWAAAIEQQLVAQPEIDITIVNNYNASSGALETEIQSAFLKDMTGGLYLCVFMVEDSIVSLQKDYEAAPEDIEDYIHRNVLRTAVNGTWGDKITSAPVNSGEVIIKTYNYAVDTTWNTEHVSVLAFIYNDETKGIIQAEQERIQP